ncbi:MAG: hypothetical protein KDD60_01230, partial [Bdellovibrionales bacterium]|nr:hypothetical protein [Bdellovibrionales bacterium]
ILPHLNFEGPIHTEYGYKNNFSLYYDYFRSLLGLEDSWAPAERSHKHQIFVFIVKKDQTK